MSRKSGTFFLAIILQMSFCPLLSDVQVQFNRTTLPVMAGEDYNPIGFITVMKTGDVRMTGISFDLEGTTDLDDVVQLSIYEGNSWGKINTSKLIALHQVHKPTGSIRLNVLLASDTTFFVFTVKLRPGALLANRINLNCTAVRLNSDEIALEPRFHKGLRVGVALRKHRQDGVHTTRIPGLITSQKGTLLAVYDARWDSARDLQGDMDIALNRSEDGGHTWQPMQIILDMKEWGGLPEKFNGVSDACILLDENTGDIYVAGLWMHGVLDRNTGEWIEGLTEESTQWIHQWHAKGSQPGLGVKETSQFLITKSSDDGLTWSEPVNITAQTKRPEWWLFAPAPGHGITLNDGTLVFPTQGRDSTGMPFSNITYSIDGGKTWTTSNPAFSNTTESMAVQLDNGDIMLNMRDNRNHGNVSPNGRRICVTSDLGKTWTEHPTSFSVLTEPTCMASLHKHYYTKNGERKSVLAFFNPNSHSVRNHMTLKLSFDEGMTWPEEYWVMLDQWGGYGYSCITSIDENTLGIVYEGSRAQLVFQQVMLNEMD
jgi:sialidase-1